MHRGGNLESGIQKIEENTGGATTTMNKDFDDTNWKQKILGSLEFNQSKFASKFVKNGAQSFYAEYLSWGSLHQMEEIERL